MVYLLGDFTQIHGIAANNKEYAVEDIVVMSFRTDIVVLGTANFNFLALDKKDKMIIYATKGKIEFSMLNTIAIVTHGGVYRSIYKNIFNIYKKIEGMEDLATTVLNYNNRIFNVIEAKGIELGEKIC